jgi:hypothetical protein
MTNEAGHCGRCVPENLTKPSNVKKGLNVRFKEFASTPMLSPHMIAQAPRRARCGCRGPGQTPIDSDILGKAPHLGLWHGSSSSTARVQDKDRLIRLYSVRCHEITHIISYDEEAEVTFALWSMVIKQTERLMVGLDTGRPGSLAN